MKKILIILVALLWCNVGFANILLNNCAYFIPAGESWGGKTYSEDTIKKGFGDGRHEYFVSYEDSVVYETFVRSSLLTDALKANSRTLNNKFVITFVDDKLITAKGKSIIDPLHPDIYTTIELEINLKKGEVKERHGAETLGGMQLLEIYKKTGTGNSTWKCEIEKQKEGTSSGTAFFISNSGYLLTNYHVVEGCKVSKIIYNNEEYDTSLISTDKTLDLALLKAKVRPKSYIAFSKDEPKKRQQIIIAGYPLGQGLSDDLKINDGRISALKGFENNSNEITVDVAINPGNSGGPIINQKGQLVAIAVAGMSKDVTEGINFGIKASAATNFLKSNKISPSAGYFNFSMDDDEVVELLEESTVYTFCN